MKEKCIWCKSVGKYHSDTCPMNKKRNYKKIYKEKYEYLTPEDMEWIDIHVKNGMEPIILSPEEIKRIIFWEQNGYWPDS